VGERGKEIMSDRLTEFGMIVPKPGLAYGVDPVRRHLYSLRQSRYQALGYDLHLLASEYEKRGQRMRLLDIGSANGSTKRYLDCWPSAKNVDIYGTDLSDVNFDLYDRDGWTGFYTGDLMDGYPDIPSESFDVVVCEQVLEHLPQLETAVKTLERLLKPGGTLFVGVPTFPHGLHHLRKPMVAIVDGVQTNPRERGHVQAFSLRSFTEMLTGYTNLEIVTARGFRIVSGGVLRPLENHRWWWQWNRWLGAKLPGLCTEIQVIARKPAKVQ
jgi:SAM-dependent methyltransferase